MTSTLTDSSVLLDGQKISNSPPEKQIPSHPEQSLAPFNPNSYPSVMDSMNSSSNQSLMEQKNQNNCLSLLASSVRKMEKFSDQMKFHQQLLNDLTTYMPNKVGEENKDSEQVNTIFSNFRTSISEIRDIYSEFLEVYCQFQQCFDSVKMQLAVTYESIYKKIKSNQVLSEIFLKNQFDDLDKARQEIEKLVLFKQSFKKELKDKGFGKQSQLVIGAIGKIDQMYLKKGEVEKNDAKLQENDNLLKKEQSKLELLQIEMAIQDEQEKRLQKDYEANLKKTEETIQKNKEEINELNAVGKNQQQLMELIQEKMKQNISNREKMSQYILQEHFNRNQNIEKMFDEIIKEINNLEITQASNGFIIVLDESSSMHGSPFQNCVNAIKQQVKYLQSYFPDDQFCMIQFGSKARITINPSAVQFVNEADIGKKFNGGGTDFNLAFLQVKEVMPLFECKVINIMFVTDGEDSNTSEYLKVLREIKQDYPNNKFQLFGLAFGSSVKPDNIKACLKEVNGNSSTIIANGKPIQSYFEVNIAEDLIKTFKSMFEAQSTSVEFDEKGKKRKDMLAQQQVDIEKMKNTLLKECDEEYGQLTKQLETLQEDKSNSQIRGTKKLQDHLNYQTEILNRRLADQEKDMQAMKRGKIDFSKQIKEVENVIRKLKIERKNLKDSSGTNKKIEDVQSYEKEICKLGFSSKSHYDKLKEGLTNAYQVENDLSQFLNQLITSLQHLNQIRKFVYRGIQELSENVETKESDFQNYLMDFIGRSMHQSNQNKPENVLSSSEIKKCLIMITSKEEYTRIKEDSELNYNFDSLYSVLDANELFKLSKVRQKRDKNAKKEERIITVDEYLKQVFKEIMGWNDENVVPPQVSKIQLQIEQLEKQLEEEENKNEPKDSKINKLENRITKLENKLLNMDDKIEEEKEKMFQQFIVDHKKQYDFTRNVIRNVRQAIQQIDFKARQNNIFLPLQIQAFALEKIDNQSKLINQLAIQ